ncbi:primosomal protein N' [Thermosynechococcus sp. M55_K2018_012]|uniref:primosomal protein N' n=1 Tax=Thermosynechococcus sp. M55_K2018_012 TaxID=2747809 RepID=UPI0019E63842|nr:primosomal protein N' [Thermosynechococcus sp. M55_K2018_012]HIK48831.1 primosomal protein N' [Thermosynechococcus sp. M55_K2018_012]
MTLAPQQPSIYTSVLVDCPGASEAYTYQVPVGWCVRGGDVVEVPFGSQVVRGIVLEVLAALPPTLDSQRVKALLAIVDQHLFPKDYWALLEEIATYYCTPLIQVVRTALPPGVLGRSQRRVRLRPQQGTPPLSEQGQHLLRFLQTKGRGDYSVRYLQQQLPKVQRALAELERLGLVETYLAAPASQQPKQQQAVVLLNSEGETLTQRQRQILRYLQQQGRDCWLQEVLEATGTTAQTLHRLAAKGCVAIVEQQHCRIEQGVAVTPDRPKTLTPAQATALQAISEHLDYAQTFLLHGVTGSGKTEVYLQAIAECLGRGRSALLLVPEIGLTPQLTDRVRARFGERLLVYHSGLSEGERYDTWRLTLMPQPRVIIGTRSAVLLPLVGLGLIILDEEHDSSYKQDQPQPCYHARTVAQWRSRQQQCPLILGTATPALSTWQAAQAGQLQILSLPQRIHATPLPPITLVDMRQELHRGNRSMLSPSLQDALGNLQGQQAILFVPRRGHSTFVSCRSCGTAIYCPHCSVSLTGHLFGEEMEVLRCHYCNYSQAVPQRCPSCASPYLKPFGGGTQRVVSELNRLLPQLRVLRFDSDTTQRKGAHRQLLTQFAAGAADVMVGTQMLTKGIDLPQVALVGILAADSLLHLPDYQAAERTFQILTQVAGRSGRGAHPGKVILQTYVPEHPVIRAVKAYDWDTFATQELSSRAPLGYPPYAQLILLRLSSPDPEDVAATAQAIAQQLQTLAPVSQGEWEVLGPAPAAIAKIAGRYRWQILLKGKLERVSDLSPALMHLKEQCPRSTRLSIDVDPLNFL